MAMAEEVGDLLQVRSTCVEPGRERMTQPMRPRPLPGQSAAAKYPSHGLPQTGERKRLADESAVTNEPFPTGARCVGVGFWDTRA